MKQFTDTRADPSRRRMNRRQALRAASLIGAGSVLAGCSRGKSSGKGASSNPGQAGTPKYGGQINIPTTLDAYDFDPTSRPSENRNPIGMAYDSFLTVKSGPGVNFSDFTLAPNIIDRWETPDAQNFTLHVHPGVKFANLPPVNGRDVTSADVKWSIEYLSRAGNFANNKKLFPSLNAPMFGGLQSIETPDASTVVVKFAQPFIPFLSYIGLEWNPILAHEVYDQDGNFSSHLVGTGPWQLDMAASQKGTRWVYKKNPTYFVQGRPYIDQVNYLVLVDDATRFAAFRTKQVDFAPGGDSGDLTDTTTADQLHRDNPNAVMFEYLTTGGGHIYENVRKPPLSDIRVRQAIELCINRDEFIKSLSGGKGDWAIAGAIEGTFSQEELKQFVKFDPAQAKQLVSAAGYPNGVDLEFPLTNDRGQAFINLIQLIQAQLKQGNINVTLKPTDRVTIGKNRRAGTFQIDFDFKTQDSDVDSYLFQTFYSKSAGNYGGIVDPQLDSLLQAERREVDTAKRKDILRQIGRRIYDQAWAVGLYHGTAYSFWQPEVKNFSLEYAHRAFPIVNSWLDR